MKYALLHNIRGCHRDSINSVAFSPNGRFLASGGDDCMLFMYDCLTGQDLVKISSSSNVTSLLWHPSSTEIWVGHANGDLQMIDPLNTTGSNFPLGLQSSIDCMVFHSNKGYLAVGTDEKILICKVSEKSVMEKVLIISPIGDNNDNTASMKPRSLHFINNGQFLVISYLEHGVICWDVMRNARVWHLVPRVSRIGFSAISSDETTLAISNLFDGLDMYDLKNQRFTHTLPTYIMENVLIPLVFVHNNEAILVGSAHGAVKILDCLTGDTHADLSHSNWDMVQAIDYCYDCSKSTHYIATGISEKGSATYVKLWKASSDEDETNEDKSNRPPKRQFPTLPWKYFGVAALLVFGFVVANHFPAHLKAKFSPPPYRGFFQMLDAATAHLGDTKLDMFKKIIYGEIHPNHVTIKEKVPGICRNLVSSLEKSFCSE